MTLTNHGPGRSRSYSFPPRVRVTSDPERLVNPQSRT
jgi:hypothetical protein